MLINKKILLHKANNIFSKTLKPQCNSLSIKLTNQQIQRRMLVKVLYFLYINCLEDTKKDAKNPQPVNQQNKQPTIELNINKKCNDFYFYLDFPQTVDQFQQLIENGIKIDMVLIIEQKNKPGSKLPDYNLLNKSLQNNDLMNNLNSTKLNSDSKKAGKNTQVGARNNRMKQIVRYIRKLQNNNPEFSSVIVKQIPFEKDLSHPENNQWNFINSLFNNLGEITIQKQTYQKWLKSQVKKVPLIQPLKQIIKKQVPIQTQDKKGKKDASKQPQFQTVQQVIQTKYQSFPQNIKSNLQTYHHLNSLKSSIKQKNQNGFEIKNVLSTCIQSIELQKNKNSNQSIDYNSKLSSLQTKTQTQPLVKLNNTESLKNNLRQVKQFYNQQLNYQLITQQKQIPQNITLQEIIHENSLQKDTLQYEYIMKTISDQIKREGEKYNYLFQNREYREKLNRKQILSEIQKELLKDPKIYNYKLKNDNINLLCLSISNPPGRVLYNNNIFQQKSIPNFQNWLNKHHKNNQNKNQFLDYKFQDIGNLSIKTQRLTPTDNVIIYDEKISFGNQEYKINHFQKNNTIYGIRKTRSHNNQFWTKNLNNQVNVSIFQQEREFKMTSKVSQIHKAQGQDNVVSEESLQNIVKQKRVEVWCKTDLYMISNTPYPTIIWQYSTKQNRSDQIKRQYGSKGQITSYLRDGSVKIYYLNGNTSSYRNNKWQRIINSQIVSQSGSKTPLSMRQFTQGDKIIRIRQDQTTFIQYSNGNTMIIFSDQTKVLYKKSSKAYEIQTYNPKLKQQIIVRIKQARQKNLNIIGHGSAFAYLGFNNLSQRSYDGFIYQIWTNQFNSHLYNQKYEYEHEIFQEEIRILYLSDGTFIKITGNGEITYIQGDNQNTQQKLRHKWNQAFTTEDLHEVGVYDVNLNQGWIKTKDDESNIFKINVQEKNEINIAVSFKINDEQQAQNNFGNGFHIPQQNYFLPLPSNSIPVRLFSLDQQTQTYYQYLTPQQIKSMQNTSSNYYVQQITQDNKKMRLYTKKQQKKQNFDNQNKKDITFSQSPQTKDFEVPSSLLSKQTKVNMSIQNNAIEFRILQKIQWNKQFQNVNKLQKIIMQKKQKRYKQINVKK